MGARRTDDEKAALAAQARQLREQGWSRRGVAAELHVGDVLLSELLEGTPVPDALRRPRARDDARDLARQLRRQGWTYDEIARELGMAKSSCSLWLRDLPHPADLPERPDVPERPAEVDDACQQRLQARRLRRDGALLVEVAGVLGVSSSTVHRWCTGLPVPERARRGRPLQDVRAMSRARWDRESAEREQERRTVKAAERTRVGPLTARELELLAVTLYWAEGAKDKPYARRERVTINSDADTVRLWVAYLDLVGFPLEHRRFRLSIHASADLDRAHREWSEVVGVPVEHFQRPTLKLHQPKTNRKNVDDGYKGCLVVRCNQSRLLYQRIEGTWQGIMQGAVAATATPSALV